VTTRGRNAVGVLFTPIGSHHHIALATPSARSGLDHRRRRGVSLVDGRSRLDDHRSRIGAHLGRGRFTGPVIAGATSNQGKRQERGEEKAAHGRDGCRGRARGRAFARRPVGRISHPFTPLDSSARLARMRRVCVFCGSSFGRDPLFRAAAIAFGQLVAKRGLGVVYGGGSVGLMGALADAALDAGGEVIGVIPEALDAREIAHRRLSKLHVVPSMHARKALMAELSDGFVALPGGFGTFEELFEVVTWAQLGLHAKPVLLLNVAGYFDPLLELVENALEAGFIKPEYRDLVRVEDHPERLIEALAQHHAPRGPQWIREDQT
jgi:uncharacterized protein (TIGR00730 family)